MTIDIARILTLVRSSRSVASSTRSRNRISLLGFACLVGCSLQDFSALTNGGAPGVGGEQPATGGGQAHQGGNGTSAGTSSTGGLASEGGASNMGGVSSEGGASGTAGASNTGGVATGGTSASSTVAAFGGSDTKGCAFAEAGGQLVVPPSQGFETGLQGWTTTSQRTTALTRYAGNGNNCEGDWYVTLDGVQRNAEWDGAALEVNSYVKVGHTYRYSIAVRQTPATYAAEVRFKLTVSRACSSPVYEDILPQVPINKDWVRLTKDFTLALPGDCSTSSLTSVKLYVATHETGKPYTSFDLDDFRLIDVTPPGALGTGGAPSTGGASSTSSAPGIGGASGAGGAPSSGGVAGTGGTKSSGGSAGQTTTAAGASDAG